MKKLSLLVVCSALLFFPSCSSGGALIDGRTLECAPGADLSISLGMNQAMAGRSEVMDDQLTVSVEVANVSNRSVEVRSIRIEQYGDDRAAYRVDGGFREFEEVIDPGDDHVFEIPTSGRVLRQRLTPGERHGGVLLEVRVSLANGDHYRCRFELPSPI